MDVYEKFAKNRISDFFLLIKVYAVRLILWFLSFFVPVKQNRIMVYSHERKGVGCNAKYIIEGLKKYHKGNLEIIFVSSYPNTCKDYCKEIEVIKNSSLKHIRMYLRTRIYLTNDCFPAWAPHFSRIIWINMWHGAINYKNIGYKYIEGISPLYYEYFKLRNRIPDYFVSGTHFFTENTSKSFYVPKSRFVEIGLPRNDLLFQQNEKKKQKTREKLGIGIKKKVVLYAPTFRKKAKYDLHKIDFKRITESLRIRFKGEWIVVIRNHNFIDDVKNIDCIDSSSYFDVSELLCITDVLISDCSSIMYDFALQEKPCFVYFPDKEEYEECDRGFAYPIEKWPYPLAFDNVRLNENILNFNMDDYKKKLQEHFNDVIRKDDGHAQKRLVHIIERYI